ncbi:transmembrane protein 14C [Colletotrichum higginsianum IMI 349063]|uniref:Transmembrane protein 14C n=1 Tax=Colletotrichum higginsianum (strain IMI 349063) TaxID=759273 RepID=A0A1B7YUD6_COLHI|nr:transmembrane protein 14C [Colletotrichum higginsianum IMI 349063]OBR15665.1 transmembrane protein 14C [Colletotrichum higginsianum IMI 349063]GJC92059.1 transmembrane protein 14C [Colletotrichum higginsianum]
MKLTSSDLSIPSFVLGALTAGGGIAGYARTGSLPSIIAGVSVGLLYGLGGYRIQNRESFGVELSLLASAVLGGSSIPRAIRLRKPVPILLSVLSVFGLFTFGSEFRRTL